MPLKSKGKKEKLRVGCLLILLFSSNHYCFSSIPTAELLARGNEKGSGSQHSIRLPECSLFKSLTPQAGPGWSLL